MAVKIEKDETIKRLEAAETAEDAFRIIAEYRGVDTSGGVFLTAGCGAITRIEGNKAISYEHPGGNESFEMYESGGEEKNILYLPNVEKVFVCRAKKESEGYPGYHRSLYGISFSDAPLLYYIDADGTVWENKRMLFYPEWESSDHDLGSWDIPGRTVTVKLGMNINFAPVNKLYRLRNTITINTRKQIMEILKRQNPWGASLCEENNFLPERVLLCPALEILYKAGYAFASEILEDLPRYYRNENFGRFDRLCRYNGRNPKEIFKTAKVVYETLKDEPDLSVWDNTRKIEKKFPNISAEMIERIGHLGYTSQSVRLFQDVLAKTYNGRRIFSPESLMRYLERIDMYEAIDSEEGLKLLNDYLNICRMIRIEPRVDGDSLKREHDIAARILRHNRTDIGDDGGVAKAWKNNCRYDYAERVYFARAVRDIEDLGDECRQQHNCVISYARSIAEGKTAIFVIREIKNPDKSLVTAEVCNGRVVQKLMAYNTKIRNKSLSDFIKRWQKYITETDRNESVLNRDIV